MKPRLSLALGLAALAGLASATNPVGKWTGKVSVTKMPPMPANATPQQRAFYQQIVASVSKIRLVLTLKPDKTYSFTTVGAPAQAAQVPHSGRWSQSGNLITAVSTTQKAPPQTLTLSADGRTMTLNQRGAKVVFTR